MTKCVEVLDAIMGSGKTNKLIEWMDSHPDEKYLYIAPYLEEVEERVTMSLKWVNLHNPEHGHGKNKSDSLLELLREGKSVGFTHSLFKLMTEEHTQEIERQGYILIIDEELSMIEHYNGVKPGDIHLLCEKGVIKVDYNNFGQVSWEDVNYRDGAFTELRNLCKLDMVYANRNNIDFLTTHLPIKLITSCKRVVVSTYLFKDSVFDCFCKMKGVETTKFLDIQFDNVGVKDKIRSLIEFVGGEQVEKMRGMIKGRRNNYLSQNWYVKLNDSVTPVSSLIRNVSLTNGAKTNKPDADGFYKDCDVMYTFPSKMLKKNAGNSKRYINPKGYGNDACWVGCSVRATNKYANRWLLIHAYNRYPNKNVKLYMQGYGVYIDDEQFALAEMVQWVWRSRIRNGEPIKLCIASERMEKLFKEWLYLEDE